MVKKIRKEKILIVVESPGKINTIKKYLPDDGKSYILLASVGHISDLSDRYKYNLGVDIDNDFKPHYILNKDKMDVLNAIIDASSLCSKVLLATDEDREGECIAYLICQRLDTCNKPIKRISFNEISRKGILKALSEERDVDKNLVDAAMTRRVLDKIVGYMASPFVIKNLGKGVSAGRVQSVALKLIVEREAEIEAFVPREYWNLKANVGKDSTQCFLATLDLKEVATKEQADLLKEELENSIIVVSGIESKPKEKNPPAPLITSTLQMLASSRYRISVTRTMEIAQELYEGGFITYMRTDSKRLSDEAIAGIREYIGNKYPEYLPETKNVYKNKDSAQDAHEAIRPTHIEKLPSKTLENDQARIYKLIWDAAIASQMTPAKYNITTVKLVTNRRKELKATGKVLVSPGWTLVNKKADIEEVDDNDNLLPQLNKGDKLTIYKPGVVSEQKFTQPPSRYKEYTLVAELEKKGIGRPATYASIIKKICETRNFIKKSKDLLIPSEEGKNLVYLLDKNFTFMKYDYTSLMEDNLELIAQGKSTYLETMNSFFVHFNNELIQAYKELSDEKIALRNARKAEIEKNRSHRAPREPRPYEEDQEPIDKKNTGFFCQACKYPMVLRESGIGYFLGCSNFPHCKNVVQCRVIGNVITPAIIEKPLAPDNVRGPICKDNMVLTSGKYGDFYSCKAYPVCRGKRKVPYGKKCPDCGGELYRTIFMRQPYGGPVLCCMQYPNCTYIEKLNESDEWRESVKEVKNNIKPIIKCKLAPGGDI